jgi:hypothetical protein
MYQMALFFILTLCGLLSKIPSGLVMAVMVFPVLDRSIPIRRKLLLVISFMVIMVPVAWWYFRWVPYLVEHYGFWHYYMGTSLGNGAKEIAAHWDQALEKFYFPALNYIGFSLFIMGLIRAFMKRDRKIIAVFSITFIALVLYVFKAGFAFYHHNYYILPYVPVMALVAGYLLSEIKKPIIRSILVFAVAVEIILNALPEFRINKDQRYKLTLEAVVAKYARPNDLIAINCGPNPQQIYLAHRKGWNLETAEQLQPAYLQEIKAKGCKILLLNRHEPLVMDEPFQVLETSDDFIIYKL